MRVPSFHYAVKRNEVREHRLAADEMSIRQKLVVELDRLSGTLRLVDAQDDLKGSDAAFTGDDRFPVFKDRLRHVANLKRLSVRHDAKRREIWQL